MKNITIVTSIPEFYSNQSFFETTEFFCRSVRRFDLETPIIVIVPEKYNIPHTDLNLTFIKLNLENSELLMSNVLKEIQHIVKTEYFIYFTTENLILKNINYNDFCNDNFYVTMTSIESDNSYFNFEKNLHSLYYKENDNKDMILEYMICGKTKSKLWDDFYNLSSKILCYIKDNYNIIKNQYENELIKYILPSADLVALNILFQDNKYSFLNFPNSFISMHPGLTEKYNPVSNDSLFYQYSGLYHHNVDKFLDITDVETRKWLSKNLIKINPKLSLRLLK